LAWGESALQQRGIDGQVDVAAADRITPTRWPRRSIAPSSSAAAARQPVGSTTIFMRSAKKRIVRTSCASLTVSTPLHQSWMTGKVSAPHCCVCAPSAMVRGCRCARSRRAPGSAARRCRPRARRPRHAHAGRAPVRRHRAARHQPAAAHAHQQRVERPHVLDQFERRRALPGHHVGVVVGRDQRHAALGGDAPADGLAVFGVAVVQHHLAAGLAVLVAARGGQLGAGASCGITITDGMPSSRADSAIACAWLPELKAITPARRCSGVKRASAL
jgi:hypothetical protein